MIITCMLLLQCSYNLKFKSKHENRAIALCKPYFGTEHLHVNNFFYIFGWLYTQKLSTKSYLLKTLPDRAISGHGFFCSSTIILFFMQNPFKGATSRRFCCFGSILC